MNTPNDSEGISWPIERLVTPIASSKVSVPGIALTESNFVQLNDSDVFHVAMNHASHGRIPDKSTGCLYTTALAGCTGVAAFSPLEDGSLVGVSHFDPVVDTVQRTNGQCASERFIQQFTKMARHLGGQSIKFLVAYEQMHHGEQSYADHSEEKPYEEWHFLRQLECLAEEAEDGTTITLQSYDLCDGPRTLVAGINNAGSLDSRLI